MKKVIAFLLLLVIVDFTFAKEISLDILNSGLRLVFDTEKGFRVENTKNSNQIATPAGTIETNFFDFIKGQRENTVTINKVKAEPNDLVVSAKQSKQTTYDTIVIKNVLNLIDTKDLNSQSGIKIENGCLLIDVGKIQGSNIAVKKLNIGGNVTGSLVINGDVNGTLSFGNQPVVSSENANTEKPTPLSEEKKTIVLVIDVYTSYQETKMALNGNIDVEQIPFKGENWIGKSLYDGIKLDLVGTNHFSTKVSVTQAGTYLFNLKSMKGEMYYPKNKRTFGIKLTVNNVTIDDSYISSQVGDNYHILVNENGSIEHAE